MSNDLAIGTVSVPTTNKLSRKPSYLIMLDAGTKVKSFEKFIAVETPELLQGFIHVKGFYCNHITEEEINIDELLTTTKKDLYVELMLPGHRVHSIKSLIFKAK